MTAAELVYLAGAAAIALIVGSIVSDAIRLADPRAGRWAHEPAPMGPGWYVLGLVALLFLWVAVATLLP